MDTLIWGNPVSEWLIALGIAAGSTVALGILKRFIVFRLGKLAERTETDIDDMLVDLVKRTRRVVLLAIGIWIGAIYLELPPEVDGYLHRGLRFVLLVQAGLWLVGLLDYGIDKLAGGADGKDSGRRMGVSVLTLIGRTLIWATVALLVIEKVFDQTVTTLLTGLGVGGIAVALALQNVLGDLFASISILLDKPFIVGDFIVVGDFLGTVEHIGVKTTRLKSLTGEQIVMGNADLVNSRVRNYKRMSERRVLFTIGVVYQTPPDVLERIPAMVRAIVEAQPKTRFERSHFKGFGDFALTVETVYHVQEPDYGVMMDTQQRINLEIYRQFAGLGIEFAYPTQTLYHAGAAPAGS